MLKPMSLASAPVVSDPALYNYAGLSYFRGALSSNNLAFINVVVIGDSITTGEHSDNDQFTNGYVGLLRRGLQSRYGGNAGYGLYPGFRAKYLSFTNYALWYYPTTAGGIPNGRWLKISGPPQYGGPFNIIERSYFNDGGEKFTLTGETFSFFDIIYEQYANSSSGTKTNSVQVDGSEVTNFTTASSSTPSFQRFRVSSSSAGNTVSVVMAPSATGYYFPLLGCELYNQTNGVLVHNLGISSQCITNALGVYNGSSQTLNYETNTHQTTNLNLFVNVMNPALTIVAMSVNDVQFQTPWDLYSNKVDMICAAFTTNGRSLLLVGCNERRYQNTNVITQPTYHSILSNAAVRWGCSFYDMMVHWGTWTNANNNSLMYDSVHPNQAGHTSMANALSNAILNVNQ